MYYKRSGPTHERSLEASWLGNGAVAVSGPNVWLEWADGLTGFWEIALGTIESVEVDLRIEAGPVDA